MGKSEITLFIIAINLVIIIFILGIVAFVIQYRKRKILHEKEKEAIDKQHKLDLLSNQLQSQQQTMQFIGGEIHDSVTQKLTLASIYSQQLEFQNTHPELLNQLGKISGIINDSLIELRDLARTLNNKGINEENLLQLLQNEAERVNDTGVCRMEVSGWFEGQMNITVKSFVFRVLQEFIQNSLKHAGCRCISIVLAANEAGLSITASDDGNGFENCEQKSAGMGLANMQRRMQLIGGTFNLQSSIGEGTLLHLFIDNKNLLTQ